mgnify:CR=1 FL=1
MPYIKTLDHLGRLVGGDVQYAMIKWFCAIYVWNYKLYKSIRTLFEKRTYQEPFDPHWINLLQMEYGSFGYKNVDTYHIFETLDTDTLIKFYNTYSTTQQQRQQQRESLYIPETLFIVKSGDRYICQGWNSEKMDSSSTTGAATTTTISPKYETSEVEFLYVEYNHPNMKDSIELNIPESFYVCENQLLSCAFVLRLLEKQSATYVYDDKYFLNVLDQNMDRIQMTMHNYIELSKTAYKLKKNDFISRHLEHETLQKEMEESELSFFPMGYMQIVHFLEKYSGLFYFLLFLCSLLPIKKQNKQIINEEHVSDSEESELDHDSDHEQKQESDDSLETQSFEIIDNKNI